MRKTAVARFVVFAAIHVLLCVFAALYAGEYSGGLTLVEQPESGVYIDGSDFSGFISLLALTVNGAVSAFLAVIFFGLMTVFSVVLLLPFRFIAVRKYTVITSREKNATLVVILAGALLVSLAVLIFCGVDAVPACLLFMLPALLIEMLMYWLTLYFRCR